MPPVAALSIPDKLRHIHWWVVVTICVLAGFGLLVLFSVAGGEWRPWAFNQGVRFVFLLVVMLVLATVSLRVLLAVAYPAYAIVLLLLVIVEAVGAVGGGSQRWIDLGIIRLQPSEFMKITVVLALARYYHYLPRVYVGQWHRLLPAAGMVLAPMLLVLMQPDLGTALLIGIGGVAILFLAGMSIWVFIGGAIAAGACLPLAWLMMHDYQQGRVLTFLDPERDPLGAGYHITQSKIAIGSGGFSGKGFLDGTQSHLQFLPEMHTDFIFAMLVEEWGMLGGAFVILLYAMLIGWGMWVALSSRSHFGKLLGAGLTITIGLYVAINMAMVMGLAPVVGVPLPLISYGGSAMMTVMIAFGLLLSTALHRNDPLLSRTGA